VNTDHVNTELGAPTHVDEFIPFERDYVLGLPDGVILGLVRVTPELAQRWLERNSRNRKISAATVDRYSRDMLNLEWPFTGDPIRFSDRLALLDGQHRLTAIVETEVALTLLVMIGFGQSVQTFMDGGRKRHISDTLALDETPNYIAVSSLVNLALLWNPGGIWVPGRGTTLFGSRIQSSAAEILAFVNEHTVVHEAARQGVAIAKMVPGARASVVGAAFLRASLLAGPFEVGEWFSKLETGAGLRLGDPVLALRNGMMRTRAEKLQNPQVQQLWRVVRAWNASRGGETMNRIITSTTLSNGNFPDMR
jgi:hypothetical protein